MKDIAENIILISKLANQNEKLCGYMAPSSEQVKIMKSNSLEIARLALEVIDTLKKPAEPVGYAGFPPSVDVRGSDALRVSDGSEESVSSMDESRHTVEL